MSEKQSSDDKSYYCVTIITLMDGGVHMDPNAVIEDLSSAVIWAEGHLRKASAESFAMISFPNPQSVLKGKRTLNGSITWNISDSK